MAGSALDQMLDAIGRYPVLTPCQQLEHARIVRRWLLDEEGNLRPKTGPGAATPKEIRAGQRAKRRMIETNMRLVVTVAHKLSGRGVPMEDLIQEGAFGLDRAIELFDPTRGYAFSTYSFWWIRQAMIRSIANHANVIRVPVNSLDLFHRAERFVLAFQGEHNRPPTDREIEKGLGIRRGQMTLIRDAGTALKCLSLDFSLTDEADASTFYDVVADTRTEQPIEEAVEAEINRDLLLAVLDHLEGEQQRVIRGRYLLGQSVADLACEGGVSRYKITEIERKGLRRLQQLWVQARAGTLPPKKEQRAEACQQLTLETALAAA